LFYRACDELGILVFQDMPALRNNGPLPDADQQAEFERQLEIMIEQHKSYPSITTWVSFLMCLPPSFAFQL
jgi:beta-galactosidase/beta-glucuronidase